MTSHCGRAGAQVKKRGDRGRVYIYIQRKPGDMWHALRRKPVTDTHTRARASPLVIYGETKEGSRAPGQVVFPSGPAALLEFRRR